MNVLYLINYAGKGGTEKYIQILGRDVSARGDRCFLVYNESGPLVQAMEELGAETIQMPMKSPFDMKAAKILASICRNKKIDLIHTQFARENYIALLSKSFGNPAEVIHTTHINMENNTVWKIMNKALMKKNQQVIAVCSSVKAHLINNKYPKEKITVIPNGIEYSEILKRETTVYEEFNIPQETFLFVTLTRFSSEKGIFFLLDSIKKLQKRSDKFKVLFAGDGPLFQEAKAYAEKLEIEEQIIFTGYRTDPDNLLAGGKCFINSSQTEASSFAMLEAMGKGLPVIATNVGGNPDIVNETGCGILVEYNDVQAMAEAMGKMINDNEFLVSCGLKSREAVKDTFNIKNVLQRTYEIYKSIIDGRRLK